MKYYPIFLDVKQRRCLVVGGGAVGVRKAMTLLDCGASVTVVGSRIDSKLIELAESESITIEERLFKFSDLKDKFLVIGATDDQELNRQIHAESERLGILCNIADRPEACNFILPSIVKKGDLVIAISTSGKSPAFAKKLRKDFEMQLGDEYEAFLELMGAIRKKLLAENHKPEAHKPLFEQLISRGLVEMIKDGSKEDIQRLLFDVLGKGYMLEELMPAKT
jgi:precorrin-2 dehydrogenase/sirohydrochlorin ferrochelatase